MALTKTRSRGINLADTFAFTGAVSGAGGENTPSFLAGRTTSNQTISASTWTKVQFNEEVYDTDNCYDNTTNYRFTPNVAGKYYIFMNLLSAQTNTHCYGAFSLNGTRTTLFVHDASQTGFGTSIAIYDMNGSTDYVEVETYQGTSAGSVSATNQYSLFGGFKLIGV